MKLIITGCEYSGTTTLAKGVCKWAESVMGGRFEFHDHWKIPNIACYPGVAAPSALTEAEQQEILALSPKFKEMLQRQSIIMHLPTGDQGPDYIMVGFHIEDTVYAPLYFDYGGPNEPQGGPPDQVCEAPRGADRPVRARHGARPGEGCARGYFQAYEGEPPSERRIARGRRGAGAAEVRRGKQ